MRFKDNGEYGGWGIHGSPCEELVGHSMSEGCIKLKPAEAKKLREELFSSKNSVKGATLDIGYDVLDSEGEKVTIWSDIYSQIGDLRGVLISRFDAVLTEKNIKNERLREILEDHKKKTENYVKSVRTFYRNFIRPLPKNTANPNVVKDNEEAQFWLGIMNESRNVKFKITDIML